MINMIHSGLSGPAGKKTRKKRSDPWAASAALFSFSLRTRISPVMSGRSSRVQVPSRNPCCFHIPAAAGRKRSPSTNGQVTGTQPQQRDAGKGVRLRQAEAERTSVDVYLNLFGNLAHGTSVMVPEMRWRYCPLIVSGKIMGQVQLCFIRHFRKQGIPD